MNDNKIKYEETKVCNKCGRELPLEKMLSNKMKDGTRKYNSRVCKECYYNRKKQQRKYKNIQAFLADESMKLKRKLKEVRHERILSIEQSEIVPINNDEIFVKLLDYRDVWISNYGRALSQYGKKYSLMHKKIIKNGEIAYQLYRNIYDGEKWTYEKRLVEAWKLVTQEFIVNYDIANNDCCWHKENNKEDNYYKNIYPLNEKQYKAVQENYLNNGIDSEESIFAIINSVEYKADNWNPSFMKRTVCGVGYLGRANVGESNPIYRKWRNMIQRCYYNKIHEYKPYYASCTVCEEWLNYANFEVWYNENYIDGKKFDLDKDILVQGNTEYAQDTCALVSHYVNTVFEDRGIKNNIVENSQTGKFDTSMTLLGKRTEIGSFDTKEIAQKELFEHKKNYIVQFAIKSKNKVPDKVYRAMLNWKVEVTD